MTRSLALLASFVFAPSLACAGGPTKVVEPGRVEPVAATAVVVESSEPTTVFLETAGMSLTPPSTCDDVVAERALDEVYGDDRQAVEPACAGACRVDTCASLLVAVDLLTTTWHYYGLASVRGELGQLCEASTEGCMDVIGVVLQGDELATIGLVEAVDDSDIPVDEALEEEGSPVEEMPADERERLRGACEAGDAAACFGLVDLPMLYYQVEWDQVRYQASMTAFERACALEPRVYCRPLQRMIDETTSDCSG